MIDAWLIVNYTNRKSIGVIKMHVGKSIQIALVQRGMKKGELAKVLGTTSATISTLCSSKACSGKRLSELAKVFNMPVSKFVALGE